MFEAEQKMISIGYEIVETHEKSIEFEPMPF